MTGTPGAAATRDSETPQRSPPCSPSYDLTGKVMLLGDSGVGKTCFLIQFKDGAFLSGTFIATVGIDFRNKVVTVDGVRVKLQIWDTAGQERFRSVTHAYYRDAQALLLLYDITNKSSFDNIRAWLTEIHEYAQRDVVIMLLGNKVSGSMAGAAHPCTSSATATDLAPASLNHHPGAVTGHPSSKGFFPVPSLGVRPTWRLQPISSALEKLWKWPPSGKAQAAALEIKACSPC
ncbi:ras-related protein Rab-37 isoform X3 [Rousettus aegyptiacus]|uniref:ras-related protein Rab-37 isoform X3 n=2 Tax=Rousettus aegyptiacus TaxID=9407 RepID=UPI00168D5317|nr:ras-related protein Rab-37 isoform X3 [Rousettus aegyptiacus]